MKIAVKGTHIDIESLQVLNPGLVWMVIDDNNPITPETAADVYVNLSKDAATENYQSLLLPIFINSVHLTLKQQHHPKNVVRINGWNGFMERNLWEIAGEIQENHIAFLNAINRKYIVVADEPGLVSARVIAMIINEAYFAKEDGISSEQEIDIAMKLGTNYPKGPFEWKSTIGIENIFSLLTALSTTDPRYTPSALLKAEFEKI